MDSSATRGYQRPAQRVFLDIDPGFNQMWQELGLANILDGYDAT